MTHLLLCAGCICSLSSALKVLIHPPLLLAVRFKLTPSILWSQLLHLDSGNFCFMIGLQGTLGSLQRPWGSWHPAFTSD